MNVMIKMSKMSGMIKMSRTGELGGAGALVGVGGAGEASYMGVGSTGSVGAMGVGSAGEPGGIGAMGDIGTKRDIGAMGGVQMANAVIRTNNLCKTFSVGGGKQLHVIKDLDLAIEEGAFTVIMGSSGSGKSTLLYAISGMDKPTSGEVWFGGEDIARYTNDGLALFRRRNCGFVFQQIHLMDSMSVMDNVIASGLLLTNDKKAVCGRAERLLLRVGIGRELWGKFPSQLAGGEAQRVGIVRALVNDPALLFADEPTGSLNSAAGAAVLDVISELHASGQSVVMVTHDIKTAARGSRILYLRDGAVSGELELPPYEGDDKGRRMDALQKFLERMGW